MRIISKKALRVFWDKHPDAEEPLKVWITRVKRAQWRTTADVKRDFPSADFVGELTVFNIKHNDFRLISRIAFKQAIIYIRFILTHKEYDKEHWKNEC